MHVYVRNVQYVLYMYIYLKYIVSISWIKILKVLHIYTPAKCINCPADYSLYACWMFQLNLADQDLLDELHEVQEVHGYGNPQLWCDISVLNVTIS